MELNKSVKLMKALSDPNRIMIINALKEKPSYVEEISERLVLAPSTVSFHLKKLEEAGLVSRTRQQYYSLFTVNAGLMSLALDEIITVPHANLKLQDERLNNYRANVIKSFFDGERLRKLPAQYKKRRMVIEKIAALFETGKEYSEQEVDETINRVYEDHCAVRRIMVDEKLMKRESGVYKLLIKPEIPDLEDSETDKAEKMETVKGKQGMDYKKAAKIEYLQAKRPAGLYRVYSEVSGKSHIGYSLDLDKIKNRIFFQLKMDVHMNADMRKEFAEHGESVFRFEILKKINPEDYANPQKKLREMKTAWEEEHRDELY